MTVVFNGCIRLIYGLRREVYIMCALARARRRAAHMLHCSSCRGLCGGARLAVRDKRVRGVRGRLWLAGDATLLHTLRTLSSHTRVFRVHPWNWWSPAPLAPRSRTPLTIHSPSTHHPLTTPHVPLYARTYTAGTVKSQLRRRHRSEPGPAPRVGAPAHQGSGEEGGGRVRAETRC